MIESCASALLVTPVKIKARIFLKAALENFNEPIGGSASSQFYITLKQIDTNF
jgi:hypothetical protein